MNASILNKLSDTSCDVTEHITGDLNTVNLELLAEHAGLCREISQADDVTPFEASIKAWAHLIRVELDYLGEP